MLLGMAVPKARQQRHFITLGIPPTKGALLMENTPTRPGRAVTFWNLPGELDMLARIAESSARRWGMAYRFKPVAPTRAIIADRARENRIRRDTLARLGHPGLIVTRPRAAA